MSLPDALASAVLDDAVIKPVWFIYMDIVGDPLRGNSSGAEIIVSGSPQADLNGTYDGVNGDFVSISPLKIAPGGSDSVTARLSGLRGLDDDTRALLADPANWQGRVVRLWRMIRDADNVQQGAIQHYYTGYMMSLAHLGSPVSLTLEVVIESYLSAFSAPSNLTYQHQDTFDPGDLSAQASLAISNGNTGSPITEGAGGTGVSGAIGTPSLGGVTGGSRDRSLNNMSDF